MQRTTAPEPGVYENIPFDDYRVWDAVHSSSLGPALRSGRHYEWSLENPRAETDALRFGRLVHCGRLEPASILDRYAVMPDLTQGIQVVGRPAKNPRATNTYRERVATWMAQHPDRTVLTQEEFDRMKGVLDALWRNERSRHWFSSMGPAEVSIVWDEETTGLRCKARVHKVVSDRLLADLKTTRDATAFERRLLDYGYDQRAAFYLDGWQAVTGEQADYAFAVVESSAPYGVRAAPVDSDVISCGRSRYRKALKLIARLRSGETPEGYNQPEKFCLPSTQTA